MSVVSELIRDMSLWKPQREGLSAFDEIIRAISPRRDIPKPTTIGTLASLPIIQSQIRAGRFDLGAELSEGEGTLFPSFCFGIATGGGKTRLMGACIAYLYKTRGYKNFFILSKGETTYNKHRLEDFSPASPKYVFKGLPHFPTPRLIDGDNYHCSAYPELFSNALTLYLFNIEKIFNERTDVEFRFHRYHENIGASFADVLRAKPDLVFLMDESHNIRAEKSLKAINSLLPILGLEFTATPKAKNIIYAYSRSEAINDGLVKRPVVLTRRDDDSLIEEKEGIKLEDGIRRHERKKALLETYCLNRGIPIVTPRVLVSAQNIAHSKEVKERLEGDNFSNGRYQGRVLLVHSGSEDEQIEQLLNLEKEENSIEVVVHVNKLKEGWDVKTIYTIIPLRASVSDILTEQTIGRGMRLPFGRQVSRGPGLSDKERKELEALDTLEIISHENYSKVLEARKEAGDEWAAIKVEAQRPEKLLEPHEIKPDGDEQYFFAIPEVQAKFHSEEKLDFSNIKASYKSFKDLDERLVGIDIATQKEKNYESILEECGRGLTNFFVRILIEEADDFDIRDKEMLQKIVQAYIDEARVGAGDKRKILFKNRGKIARDLLDQIREKTEEKIRIDYVVSDRLVKFRPHWHSMPKGEPAEKHKDAATERELTRNIIGGYKKTIFAKNIFDSRQEKVLADILDRDEEVVRWMRIPINQLPIPYKGGNYNPDFIAETADGKFYMLEVKARNKIRDEDTLAKTKAGVAWCETMSKATGKLWSYELTPHDAIAQNKSFRGIISSAIDVGGLKN